jgi:DUF971 family protein
MGNGMVYPESISNDSALGVMEVEWSDGSHQRFDNALLRRSCQCADCKSLRLRSGDGPGVSDEIRIKDIRPVGSYAVQLVFSDGHERGIFPWSYLKGLDSIVQSSCNKRSSSIDEQR